MPSEKINMHGKIYDLLDNVERTKEQAQAKAIEIRANGQVAFLNPQKRKDQSTNFWIYVADKTVRRSSRKSISSKLLLEEYKKGSESFGKFMKDLEVSQQPAKIIDLAINELPKQVVKASKKTNGKKVPSKAKNGKKTPTKAKNGKKTPSKAKNGKKTNNKK